MLTVAMVAGIMGAALIVLSLQSFFVSYKDALTESATHPGYVKYVDLFLDCDEKADMRRGVGDSEYADLVREQCRQKQIPYFVVHLWSVLAVVIACATSFAHACCRGSINMRMVSLYMASVALVSVVVSAYYVLYCIGSLSRLVRCADYEVQDVAMIKLGNNFCITEMGRPDIDTAFELMGYLTQSLLGEICAFVGMALVHVAFLGFVGFPSQGPRPTIVVAEANKAVH